MARSTFVGSLLAFPLVAAAAGDAQRTIPGGHPILPARFVADSKTAVVADFGALPSPASFQAAQALQAAQSLKAAQALKAAQMLRVAHPLQPAPAGPLDPLPLRWSPPLVDRTLTASEREENLAPELQEAINRIEPIYDPTRLDGPQDVLPLHVSAGTASMNDVFGERWTIATDDPNVNAKVYSIAMAWQMKGPQPCDAFAKNRVHDIGAPALTQLFAADCARLQIRQVRQSDGPIPIVVARISVPVFAAPLPGSRMSSGDFWAAQRSRIDAIQARLHRKWEPLLGVTQAGLSP